jgi:hypothetical protein
MNPLSWQDILIIRLQDPYALSVQLGPIALAILLLTTLLVLIFRNHILGSFSWQAVECNVNLGNTATVKIKPNHEVIQIAHQAWTELTTRKAAIPFDETHDVIVEVYSSWYELFREIRKLIREIPAHRVRNDKNTEKLVDLMVTVLNDGLRPHLTQWQAKFRKWYEEQKVNSHLSPQEIQKQFPEYQILVQDLKRVNRELILLSQCLKALSHGN